jgi:hypothetical protein
MTPPNRRYDVFRLPADYEGPLVPGEPAVNRFDPTKNLCVKCLRCRECGDDLDLVIPLPSRRLQR